MSDQSVSDEIDLIELFEILWNGKWLIIATTGLASVITLIGLLIFPGSYEQKMTFRPLSVQQMNAYAPLNNVPNISPPIYAGEILIGYTGVITSEGLMEAFIGEFESGRSLQAAIAETDPVFATFEGSPQEKSESLIQASLSFGLEYQKNSDTVTLIARTRDPLLSRAIIQRFIEISAANIRRDNLVSVANLGKSIETSLNYEIEELQRQMENDRLVYFDELSTHTNKLAEQAKIARALGLANPMTTTNISTSVTTGGAANNNKTDSGELFMRGYKALEAELRVMKDRDDDAWQLHIANFAQKKSELRKLESDKRLQRIETGLSLSPLSDRDNFTPAQFDTDNIVTKPARNKLLTLVLVTLFAGIVSSITALFRYYYRMRRTLADQ